MPVRTQTLPLGGPLLIVPERHEDARGWIAESYNDYELAEAIGRDVEFRQDIDVFSAQSGTLRGLHFQHPPFAQAKLVRVVRGAILDVLVDIREGSPTFGQHTKIALDQASGHQLWIPEGFAHGMLSTRVNTQVAIKVSAIHAPHAAGRIRWDDPLLFIDWGVEDPIVSENDRRAPEFKDLARPIAVPL